MKKLILFAGTTEGRELVRRLRGKPIELTVCVATEYGRELIDREHSGAHVLEGRLDEPQMRRLFEQDGYFAVVDATHPYAAAVTQNIRAAAQESGTRYIRLLRAPGVHPDAEGCVSVPDARAAAEYLAKTEGAVLLTTGSKELDIYAALPDFAQRLYPRVLPSVDSVARCIELGYAPGHIIAMQGPFSQILNAALLRQFDIRWLVTKDGGRAGGFEEKIEAARRCGAKVVLIERPLVEQGLSLAQTEDLLLKEIRKEQEG